MPVAPPPTPLLVQGIRQGSATNNALNSIVGTVGIGYRLPGVGHGRSHPTQGQLQLAEIAIDHGGVIPVIIFHQHLRPGPHRLQGLAELAQGLQTEGRLVEQPGSRARA